MAMLHLLLPIIAGGLAGLCTGSLMAHRLLSRRRATVTPIQVEPADPFISAELDQAAARWATDTGQPPQAAPLMADKLHLLYALSRRHRP
jgi:hypothetical protein